MKNAKLAIAEGRRQALLEQMMPTNEALALITAISVRIKTHVKDPAILNALGREISSLLVDK